MVIIYIKIINFYNNYLIIHIKDIFLINNIKLKKHTID